MVYILLVSSQVDAPAGKRVVFEETLHSRPVLKCVAWTSGWHLSEWESTGPVPPNSSWADGC